MRRADAGRVALPDTVVLALVEGAAGVAAESGVSLEEMAAAPVLSAAPFLSAIAEAVACLFRSAATSST